jgi:hypothetical protein
LLTKLSIIPRRAKSFHGAGGIMKMVTEYMFEAAKFERMATETNNIELKVAFKKQADEYRKLAVRRAKELGIPPPNIPEEK